MLSDRGLTRLANGGKRIVTNFAARHIRKILVQEIGEHANQASLGLPAQAEQDEVVLGEHRVDHLRHHRIFIAYDSGKQRLFGAELGNQVLAQLVFDRAGLYAGGTKLSERRGKRLFRHQELKTTDALKVSLCVVRLLVGVGST